MPCFSCYGDTPYNNKTQTKISTLCKQNKCKYYKLRVLVFIVVCDCPLLLVGCCVDNSSVFGSNDAVWVPLGPFPVLSIIAVPSQ